MEYIPFQQREGLCGPACLKIILRHYSISKTEREIAKLAKASKSKGVEALKLLEAAKKLGLRGFVKEKAEIGDIKNQLKNGRSVIVEWFYEDDGHFSVVLEVDKENIYLQDPDLGHMRSVRLDIFKRIWFTFPGEFIKTKNDLILRQMIVVYK